MECRRDDRRYPKLSTEMEPTCYQNARKQNNTQSTVISTPRKKGFRKTLPSLERPVHVVAERELTPKLRMEEKEEGGKKKNKILFVIPEICEFL